MVLSRAFLDVRFLPTPNSEPDKAFSKVCITGKLVAGYDLRMLCVGDGDASFLQLEVLGDLLMGGAVSGLYPF